MRRLTLEERKSRQIEQSKNYRESIRTEKKTKPIKENTMNNENIFISDDQNLVNEFAKTYIFVDAPDFNCCNDVCAFSDRNIKFCIELGICIPKFRKYAKNGYFKSIRK